MNQPVGPIPAGACEIETYPGEAAERRVAAGAFAPAGKRVRVLNPLHRPLALGPALCRSGHSAACAAVSGFAQTPCADSSSLL